MQMVTLACTGWQAALRPAHATSANMLAPDELLDWITASGGGASAAVGKAAGVRGLVSTCDAAPGDVLLEVPLACCLSTFADETTSAIEPPNCSKDAAWDVQLTCAVIQHRGDSTSAVARLLESWPEAPPAPLFCAPEEVALANDGLGRFGEKIEELQIDSERERCVAMRIAHQTGDDRLASALAEPRAYREALALVRSRALAISATPPTSVRYVLCPMIDLANHEAEPTAFYHWSPVACTGGAVRLVATRALRAGEAITLRYADDVPNRHYAQCYGFIPRDNHQNGVETYLADVLRSAAMPEVDLGSAAGSAAATSEWTTERMAALGVTDDGVGWENRHILYSSAPSAWLLTTLRALLSGSSVVAFLNTRVAAADMNTFRPHHDVAPFLAGDEAVAEAAFRCIRDAASAAAARVVAAAEATPPSKPMSAPAALLVELREDTLSTLTALEANAAGLASAFAEAAREADDGSAADDGAHARALAELEAAMAQHAKAPPPHPFEPAVLEDYAQRQWDWHAKSYV